ncbi:DUF3179 domain-containing (seleno)protein [Vibrio breoganii]|uniref:DUF3179 domain-containing (seleno)protein n=1 Tax=Vibrio breoganii TaxID=553239 RepID=UPI000C852B24|nr:DUF3179 domain-containing (seleno)protein [Vibrio breoganii]PMF67830.1 hypothetical protein BCV08_03430 [Vibrio breoganii]PMH11819.1 hypothetical protein BCU74_18085 [Vibrio breoganii]PMP12087.1 hypothetical protein BCS94_03175 [Vibrio breoganii]TKG14541.1 DUF3179 domain-containing protein [Vibrio breoganii]
MLTEILFWVALIPATITAFIYFRDLGDITQSFLPVKRKDMMFAIRHEKKMILIGIIGTLAALYLHLTQGVGSKWVIYILTPINLFCSCFPYIWLYGGLRNQQSRAKYYSIEEARNYVRPDESVIVLENNGHARAHSDYHIKRPHLAGNDEGLGGENVIITYCCMTHLGHGFKPEIDGEVLDLEIVAQHGNNLIMRDKNTGEPVQQMYGTRERDGRWSENKMEEWPTFRMPFKEFAKAYPEGEVFLNKITPFTKNPVMFLWDWIVEIVFLWATVAHHRTQSLLCKTMDVIDDRLYRKELVWGFTINKESMAYTEDYIIENGNVVNATVGGKDIVAAYDPEYKSVNIWYNTSGKPVTEVDFFGKSDQGELKRVETVKAGMYWFVWINYYPESQLNDDGVASQEHAHLFGPA